MKTNFPTINELMDALRYFHYFVNVRYNASNYTFECVELVPYKVYDSGGSLDSIGYDECVTSFHYTEVYKMWEFHRTHSPKYVDIVHSEEICDTLPF